VDEGALTPKLVEVVLPGSTTLFVPRADDPTIYDARPLPVRVALVGPTHLGLAPVYDPTEGFLGFVTETAVAAAVAGARGSVGADPGA
jgi:hypothetical protein